MIKTLHAKVGEQRVILFTDAERNPLAARLLQDVRHLEDHNKAITEVERQEYREVPELRRLYGDTGVTLVPLFDYRRRPVREGKTVSPIKRQYRFVSREGKAPFPDWATEPMGVMIHETCTTSRCISQILRHFPVWTRSRPRRRKLSRREREVLDARPSYLA